MAFWDAFRKYAGQGIVWAASHPEVIAQVATLAGQPQIAAALAKPAVAVPVAPANGVPLTNPPIEAPVPAVPVPVLTLAQKWEDRVQDLARDILGYNLTDVTELRDFYKLMEAGRRDEVIRDLIGKLPSEQQAAKRAYYGV